LGVLLLESVSVVVGRLKAGGSQRLWGSIGFVIPLHGDEAIGGGVEVVFHPDVSPVTVHGIHGSDFGCLLLTGKHGVVVVCCGSHPPVDNGSGHTVDVQVALEQVTLVDLQVEVGVEALHQVSPIVSFSRSFEKEVGHMEPHSVHEAQELIGGF